MEKKKEEDKDKPSIFFRIKWFIRDYLFDFYSKFDKLDNIFVRGIN